jgi:hypothetical protein
MTQPWWVQATYRLGVPAALAIFLVWFLTSRLGADLASVHAMVQTHVEAAQADRAELRFYLRQMVVAMQATCVNAAHDASERRRCLALTAGRE